MQRDEEYISAIFSYNTIFFRFEPEDPDKIYNPEELLLGVGGWKLEKDPENWNIKESGEMVKVKKISVPGRRCDAKDNNDLAILHVRFFFNLLINLHLVREKYSSFR